MSNLIQPSVGTLATSLGVTLPALTDFQIGVPVTDLIMLRRWNARTTLTSGAVSLWEGVGSGGSQPISTKRPLVGASYLTFDGVDDYIPTDVVPLANGYLVVKILGHDTTGGAQVFAGSAQSTTQRVAIGCDASEHPAANIGSLNFAFYANLAMVKDTAYVIGVTWSGGTATIRVNGVQQASSTYTGDQGNVGVAVGARANPNAGGADTFSGVSERVIAAAMYGNASSALTSSALAAIDAALMAY